MSFLGVGMRRGRWVIAHRLGKCEEKSAVSGVERWLGVTRQGGDDTFEIQSLEYDQSDVYGNIISLGQPSHQAVAWRAG